MKRTRLPATARMTSRCEDCQGWGWLIVWGEVEACGCTPDQLPAEMADKIWSGLSSALPIGESRGQRVARDLRPGAA